MLKKVIRIYKTYVFLKAQIFKNSPYTINYSIRQSSAEMTQPLYRHITALLEYRHEICLQDEAADLEPRSVRLKLSGL